MTTTTENATIESTYLGIEDHGTLTFYVHLSGDGWGQGLGGCALDQYGGEEADRSGWGPGLTAIRRILEVVGVRSWEELPGKFVRVRREGLGSSGPPILGHIIEDRWFDLKTFMRLHDVDGSPEKS